MRLVYEETEPGAVFFRNIGKTARHLMRKQGAVEVSGNDIVAYRHVGSLSLVHYLYHIVEFSLHSTEGSSGWTPVPPMGNN